MVTWIERGVQGGVFQAPKFLPPVSEGWGKVPFSVCQFTPQWGGRGVTPSQVWTGGGTPSQVWTGGTPPTQVILMV